MFELRDMNCDLSNLFGFNGYSFNGNADLEETTDAYLLKMNVTGILKENINIDYEDDVLTISVKQKNESKEETKYLRREIASSYNFSRGFQMKDIEEDTISAKLSDGVLMVVAKKTVPQKIEKKTISIE